MKINLIAFIKSLDDVAKRLLLIIALFGVNYLNGVRPILSQPAQTVSPSPTSSQQARGPQITISQPSAPAVPSSATTAQPVQTSQYGQGISDLDLRAILNFPYPWSASQQSWIHQAWPYMTPEQQNYINQDYAMKRQRASATTPYLSTRSAETEEKEIADEASSWSAEKTFTGTKERIGSALGWGWQKGKEAYQYATSIPGSLWGYKSSLGTGTKATVSATAFAATPYALGAAGLGAPALAAGAAAYGVTSLLDRLEFRYQSGHWSESTAASFENLRLQEALDDSLAYPTISVKIEALGDPLELVTDAQREGDKFDVSKKARMKLRQAYQKKLSDSNEITKQFDKTVSTHIYEIRGFGNYIPEAFNQLGTNDEKIAMLQNYMNWLQGAYNIPLYEAILSEYMRALKKSNELRKQKEQTKSKD